jgi:guanylate kinase
MPENKLLLFCGPSGSGKTTIVQHLLNTDKRLAFSISATTRPQREEEIDGKDYYFISTDDFRSRINAGDFVEWEEVYKGRFYGTLHSEIKNIWNENKIPVFDVDVEGGLKIKKIFGQKLLSVFVCPPSIEELRKRLHARNSETPESFKARISKSELELTYASRFDVVIVNNKLEDALRDAKNITDEFLSGVVKSK